MQLISSPSSGWTVSFGPQGYELGWFYCSYLTYGWLFIVGLTSYNAVLTSSVESSGGSASEVGATTDLERGDDVSGDAEVRCSSSGGIGTPCDDSACFTHSQCTPDDCCMLESSESCSSLLMEKQNSDAGWSGLLWSCPLCSMAWVRFLPPSFFSRRFMKWNATIIVTLF